MPARMPDDPLMAAVKACREDTVRALLDTGCREDTVDADGRTALHWACQYGHLRIACCLVSSAAMTDFSCWEGGHANATRGLHCHVGGADKTIQVVQTSWRESPGHAVTGKQAIPLNSPQQVPRDRRLYDVINRRDAKGHTALHLACNFRREEVAIFLATLPQCDVNAGDLQGHTPLHRAIHCNLETVVGVLCKAGADVRARNAFLWTPLHEAARTGNVNVVRMLVNRGCDVNPVTSNGMTPFLTAVFYYRIAQRATYKTLDDVLRNLLETGCRLSQGDSQWTPLSAAIAVDNSLIAGLLLFYGCRFERRCPTYGRSLLVEAFSRCEPFVATLLVECGYQPNSEEIELCSRRIPSFSPVFLRLGVAGAQTVLKEKCQLLHWLRQRVQTVCSLHELCRTAIRLALNQATADTSILRSLAQLPLPSSLLEFVRLQKFAEHLKLSCDQSCHS